MNRPWACLLICAAGFASPVAGAEPEAEQGVEREQGIERERIARRRAEVEARLTQRLAVCRERFAVTDCIEDAERERRMALAPLRRQANELDDVQRRQRAALRLEAIRGKTSEARARDTEAEVRELAASQRKAIVAPADEVAPSSSTAGEVKQKPARSGVVTPRPPAGKGRVGLRQKEAAHPGALEARQKEAQAHREAVTQRNLERARRGKPAAPLPVP